MATDFTYGDPVVVAPIVGTSAPVWPKATFPDGYKNNPYLQDVDFWPARPNVTVTLISGALPPGLALSQISPTVWRLSGTPTTLGSYTFSLRAANSYGSADRSFTLAMNAVAGTGTGSGGAYTFVS